jgi:hypothetical protein
MFLARGSIAVAAASVASSVPKLVDLADSGAQGAAAAVPENLPEGAALTEPILAHVRDLSSGEINLLVGEREVVLHDPQLVARLYQASR